jgi:hypothetical protein
MREFQKSVGKWMVDCFGEKIAYDSKERNFRFLEEALELVQSNDCTKEDAYKLVDYVFNRPKGEFKQEVGGVMVTLAALCNIKFRNIDACAWSEYARIVKPDAMEKIRAKQVTKEIINKNA